MNSKNLVPEPVRILVTIMTGAIVMVWAAGGGMHLFRGDPKAWYDFPLLLSIVYSAMVVGVLSGAGAWKLMERFK